MMPNINTLKYGVILVAVAVALYSIYNYGYSSAESVLQPKLDAANKQLEVANTVQAMQKDISAIASILANDNTVLKQDIEAILAKVGKAPITVIKNGECTLSRNFVAARDEAISRVNSGLDSK